MAIKLIALDMDNTLLNRKKLVSPENALAIQKAKDKGIYVTIATGRMPASASYFAKQLQMNCPIISCNGGVVKDLVTNKSIYEAHFTKETIRKLITTCYEHNWYARWYIDDNIYVRYVDMNMFPAYKTTKGLNIIAVGDDFENYLDKVTQLVICDLMVILEKSKIKLFLFLQILSVYNNILNILWILHHLILPKPLVWLNLQNI